VPRAQVKARVEQAIGAFARSATPQTAYVSQRFKSVFDQAERARCLAGLQHPVVAADDHG